MKTCEIKFFCPNCDQTLKCGSEFAGRLIECPACKQMVRIPQPSAENGAPETEPPSWREWDTRAWGG